MKSSTFARTVELAKLAARVGFKEIRSGDMRSRLEQAALIAKSLANLKGAAMKVGQLLSLDLSHYFPPEAIEVLSQLQNAATAQPFSQIENILKEQLGSEKFAELKNISQIPIGVASIGQVHRAKYQNQDIVVKVQYEGVADSIEADLKILKSMATDFCQLTGRQMNLDPLFTEFRNILEQEVDYRKESQFQMQYRKLAAQIQSEKGFQLRVPAIIEELSSDRVIAMNFESGVSLRSWIQSRPPKQDRERLATAILDLYCHEFFEWGLVQTDPNWANFLVDESNGKSELVLLDFGASRTYSHQFTKDYIELLRLVESKDSESLKQHTIKFGLLDPRESNAAFAAFEELLKTAIKPFFPGSDGSAIFDFADLNHSLNSQNAGKALSEELVYSPPPYGIVFLHRKLAGVYSILKSLEVSLDVTDYWKKMQELASRRTEGKNGSRS